MQEEALSQELTERQDQEKKLKDEIAKLEILFMFAFYFFTFGSVNNFLL